MNFGPLLLLLAVVVADPEGPLNPYESNPFLNGTRQNLNQYQVAVVLPPTNYGANSGGHFPGNIYQPGYRPAEPPGPTGSIYLPGYGPPGPPGHPIPTLPPVTKPPYVTIEPAGLGELERYCLKPRGQFPSKWCNKFVNCWEGNAVEQFCPPTLVFNPKGYCDYDYNVDCQGKPIAEFPTLPPGHGGWPTDGSYHSPPTKSPPITLPTFKPTGTAGPPVTYPPITKPTQPPTGTYRPTAPTVGPTIPTHNPQLIKYCLKPRGQFPGTSCNKYVNCWDGFVVEQDCPEGLHFNAVKSYCDYPFSANCLKVGLKYAAPELCPKERGSFRNKTNCARYYTCENYEVIGEFQCDDGYLFDDGLGICDSATKVNCLHSYSTGFNLSTANAELCKYFPDRTVFRLSDDCANVIVCRQKGTEFVRCPIGLTYDSLADSCLQPNPERCSTYYKTETEYGSF